VAFSEEVEVFSHMQKSKRVYILRGVQRRCGSAVGGLGVAACLACVAAAVDWQAWQSCRVRGGVN